MAPLFARAIALEFRKAILQDYPELGIADNISVNGGEGGDNGAPSYRKRPRASDESEPLSKRPKLVAEEVVVSYRVVVAQTSVTDLLQQSTGIAMKRLPTR